MASYRDAVEWIAANDNAGDDEDAEEVAEYVSVLLVADLWRKDPMQIARKVVRLRRAKR